MTMFPSTASLISLPREAALLLGISEASAGSKIEFLTYSYVDLELVFQLVTKAVNEWDVAQISKVHGNLFVHFINGGEIRFAVMSVPQGYKPDLAIRVEEDPEEAHQRLLRHLDQLDKDAEKRARRA